MLNNFFTLFKDELLKDNQKLLRKITFLLRIACKEPDDQLLQLIGEKNTDLLSLKYILTKPRGKGWEVIIKFVFDNLDEIGLDKLHFILPVIHDWNGKFKQGETTKLSSLIALKLYQRLIDEDIFVSDEEIKEKILQTILYGVSEIKGELENILEEVIKNKWKNHRDPYYELCEMILNKTTDGISVYYTLPKLVLSLADLYWSYTPKKDYFGIEQRFGIGPEEYYGIEDFLRYSPESAYQTPILYILNNSKSLQEGVNFILKFTNKAVENLAKSKCPPYEIELFLDEKLPPIKQYISSQLWCMYRGTQVAPAVLQCLHMALENRMLYMAKNASQDVIESWLLYLLKKFKILLYNSCCFFHCFSFIQKKTFNIAKILFKTKDLFLYDTGRWSLDRSEPPSLGISKAWGLKNEYKDRLHYNDREESFKLKHRSKALEQQLLMYQWFKSEDLDEKIADARQKELWDILDDHHKKLPKESKQTDQDKTWRLYLARMDRRTMDPELEKTEEGLLVKWNPEIDPELKKFSEESIKESSETIQNLPLQLWASYKIKNEDDCKKYEKYEKNPKTALKEVKAIIKKIEKIDKPEKYQLEHNPDEAYYLLNSSIPIDVCSLLIRDYSNKLTKKEKNILQKSHTRITFCVSKK